MMRNPLKQNKSVMAQLARRCGGVGRWEQFLKRELKGSARRFGRRCEPTASSDGGPKSKETGTGVFCTATVAPSTKDNGRTGGGQRVNGRAVNKQPVLKKMSDTLYTYLLDHTREPKVLAELREVTAPMRGSQMQISPEQGQFMSLLVELLGVKKAIEIGVYTGYSSLCIAMALPPDGKLVALDRDEKTLQIARRYWDKAGVMHKIDERFGPAEASLRAIAEEEGYNSYDFAFIDADKGNYDVYYEMTLNLVRPGGLIVVDNVLFSGKVIDPQVHDRATKAIRALNDKIFEDERVSTATATIADGLTLCRKL